MNCVNGSAQQFHCAYVSLQESHEKNVHLYISQHKFEHRPLHVCSLPLNPLKQLVLKPFHFLSSSRDPTLSLFLSL